MKNKIFKIIFAVLSSFVLLTVGLFLYLKHVSSTLPQINSLEDYKPPVSSFIYSKDGVLLLEFSKEKRSVVKKDDIPKTVVDAFLSAEDDNFFEHQGVDYLGIIRAFLANIRAGRVVQGGSTITQQVAKSLLLSKEKTIIRKIKDFMLAQRIEEKFTKDEILLLYLNQVYLGGGYYGVKSAFEGYFDKSLDEATIAESALVAGLLVAPGRYSPYVNPHYAKVRQKYVLKRMYETKRVTKEQYEEAVKEEIKFKSRKDDQFKAKYFTDWILQRLLKQFGEESLYTNGLTVLTTLNYELQLKAEKSVMLRLREVDKRQGYRGILRKTSMDDLSENMRVARQEIYSKKSHYFVLKNDGKKIDEYYLEKKDFDKLFESINDKHVDLDKISAGMWGGNDSSDLLLKVMEINESYRGIILSVDEKNKIIFVSVGGVIGFIPERHYKWALTRKSGEKILFPQSPSKAFSPGDEILVKLEKKEAPILKEIPSLEKNSKGLSLKALKAQQYAIFSIDQEPIIQGALLAVNPTTGEIISMVGGYDFNQSKFNRAVQSNRQPGSSIKPLIYGAGLEEGFVPNSIILDTPEALESGDLVSWKPRNYDGEFKGPITFREALEESRNIPTIKILKRVGVANMINFLRRFGITSEIPKDLSISLGSFGMSLIDIVRAYSIFPNQGRKIDLKSVINIKDQTGKSYDLSEQEIAFPQIDPTQVTEVENADSADTSSVVRVQGLKEKVNNDQRYDPRLAFLMTQLLRGVIQYGTGAGARDLSSNIAGKTGTTNEYVDAWFVGFSPTTVTGVWVGYDDNRSIGHAETGGRTALPIWIDYMNSALEKFGDYAFSAPDGVVPVKINKKTGKVQRDGAPSSFIEYFLEGMVPGKDDYINDPGQANKSTILGDDEFFNNQ